MKCLCFALSVHIVHICAIQLIMVYYVVRKFVLRYTINKLIRKLLIILPAINYLLVFQNNDALQL